MKKHPMKKSMKHSVYSQRSAGVLLHPTSLPGPHGIGSLGKHAFAYIDLLAEAHVSIWQILPLMPAGMGNSPYAARSTFAGNELLIDLDLLAEWGLLDMEDFSDEPRFSPGRIDFDLLIPWKMRVLERAAERFLDGRKKNERKSAENGHGEERQHEAYGAGPVSRQLFRDFCRQHTYWLDDYALFAVITADYHGDPRWYAVWDKALADRDEETLHRFAQRRADELDVRKVLQYFFSVQWMRVKDYANSRGISIIGDIPIFVSGDSADTWAQRQLFRIDDDGSFTFISGVPPDNFSDTGQLWGTPVYDWEANRREGFDWWIRRIAHALSVADIVRIDHFRGFQACWEVPGGDTTAENGSWVEAPGQELFDAARERLGQLPIIAEDLGVITPEVDELRIRNGFPGMKVLQFAFEPGPDSGLRADHQYLPHNYGENFVAYTGTHDNETTQSWYDHQSPEMKDCIRRYLARPDQDMVWSLLRVLLSSHARHAVAPFQDLLSLKNDARMNTPATVGVHNWSWRMPDFPFSTGGSRGADNGNGSADAEEADSEEADAVVQAANRLREMISLYGRHQADQS